MKCEFLLTYHADLTPAVEVGGGPFGTRVFFEVKGGTFPHPPRYIAVDRSKISPRALFGQKHGLLKAGRGLCVSAGSRRCHLEALVVPRVRGHFAAYAFSTPEALAT
jgi:hypothetical protein